MPKLQVKICGVKTKEAVDAAVRGGAAYIGLNFYPPSPRYVSPEAAAQLALLLPARVKAVAVLVDPTDELLEQIFSRFRPALLQLHGHEPPARVAELKARYNVPVIKALPISTEVDFDAVNDYAPVADYFLFEGRPPKGATLPGGNASSFDWKLMNTRAI
ncbi:MAG TPA: phosphoribosylanthranilate isomerase, partial [Alphaproteobacteria bacterium]|nr:phosphoribosylanthranilate isomerase [Alphaproteobacteria bacterium]